jgi:hypothetical protein
MRCGDRWTADEGGCIGGCRGRVADGDAGAGRHGRRARAVPGAARRARLRVLHAHRIVRVRDDVPVQSSAEPQTGALPLSVHVTRDGAET